VAIKEGRIVFDRPSDELTPEAIAPLYEGASQRTEQAAISPLVAAQCRP
jgi:ABC-type phosphate/phosphonate transport system ATPase subunit